MRVLNVVGMCIMVLKLYLADFAIKRNKRNFDI